MKKTKEVRSIFIVVLSFMLVLLMPMSAFAQWVEYNSTYNNTNNIQTGNVSLSETWSDHKQTISFYSNGQCTRSISAKGNSLWINDQQILYDLYDTCWWCFDQYGNCFAINKNQRLLLCKSGSMGFLIESTIYGCTGFQRDQRGIGYLVYTNSGNYDLGQLLNSSNFPRNSPSNINTIPPNYNNNNSVYPYVQNVSDSYFYYKAMNRYYKYYLYRGTLYYQGMNNIGNSNMKITTSVDKITFTRDGYIVYALTSGNVYKLELGKTSSSYAQRIGKNKQRFRYFDESNYMSERYFTTDGDYVYFDESSRNYYDDDDDDYNYPYVEETGNGFIYKKNKSQSYEYYLERSNLYYNDRYGEKKIASSVEDFAITRDGYIVYALESGTVYKIRAGVASSNNKKCVGYRFEYFDFTDDGFSEGYYDQDDDYNEF